MNSFLRVVRLTLVYRWTLAAAMICSLMVGLLWGANIGAVYPFIEVLFRGHSMHQWVDNRIETSQGEIARIDEEIAAIERGDADEAADANAAGPPTHLSIARLENDRDAHAKSLALSQRLEPVIKRWLPEDPYQTLVLVIAFMFLGTLLKDLFLIGNDIFVERATQLGMLRLRMQFFRSTMRLDLASLGENKQGELTSRFAFDMQTLSTAVRTIFGRATIEPLKMIVCLALAACICWRLLVFSLLLAPVAGFVIQKLAKSIKRANRRAMEEMSRLVGQLSESIDGIEVVKAFTMERYERSRFHSKAKEFYHKSMKIVFYSSLTKPVTEVLGIGVISVALLAGAYLVLQQQTHLFGIRMCSTPLTLPAAMAFYGLLAGISDPARKIAAIYNTIQPGFPAADRVYQMINRQPAIVEPATARATTVPHRQLIFDNVGFQYKTGEQILHDVSFTLNYGETLAIVGPNGCGKTTLANLVPRFYDVTAGSVKLDDVDLRDMKIRELRNRFGIVTQQAQLFDDTVLNNIRYGSPHASEEQIIAAARQAHAHRFIEEKLEDGYQTVVGPRGNKLSGGQRQRIALARAILRDPEILILDEATSQVDIESEQLIHQVLEKFVRNRTAIMITHRMSTLALADRILVMDGGRIADLGTHEELIARCELYQRLDGIQFRRSA